MMKKNERLVLIEITPFTLKDKQTGEDVEKIRHTFINKKNEIVNYYLNPDECDLSDYVVDRGDGTYHEEDSHAFFLLGRIWNDEIKWRLSPESPV